MLKGKFQVIIQDNNQEIKDNIFKALINKKHEIRINFRQAQSTTLRKIDSKANRIILDRQLYNNSVQQKSNYSKEELQPTKNRPFKQQKNATLQGFNPHFFQVIRRSKNRLASIGWSQQSFLKRTSNMSRTYRRIRLSKHNQSQNMQKFMTMPIKQEAITSNEKLCTFNTIQIENKGFKKYQTNSSKSFQQPLISPRNIKRHQTFLKIQNNRMYPTVNISTNSSRIEFKTKSFFHSKNMSEYLMNKKIISFRDKMNEKGERFIKSRSLSIQNIKQINLSREKHPFIKNQSPFSLSSNKNRKKVIEKRPCSNLPTKKSQTYYQPVIKNIKESKKKVYQKHKRADNNSAEQCRPWSVSKIQLGKEQYIAENIQAKIALEQKDQVQSYIHSNSDF